MDQNSLESGHQAKEIEMFAHKRVWLEVKPSMQPISPPDISLFSRPFPPLSVVVMVMSTGQRGQRRPETCGSARLGRQGAMGPPHGKLLQGAVIKS